MNEKFNVLTFQFAKPLGSGGGGRCEIWIVSFSLRTDKSKVYSLVIDFDASACSLN